MKQERKLSIVSTESNKEVRRTKKFPPMLNQSLKGRLSLARVIAMHAQLKSFVNEQTRGLPTLHPQGYLRWIQAIRILALCECKALTQPARDDFYT